MNRKTGALIMAATIILSGCSRMQYRETKVIIEEVYRLEGADNMEFIFSKDSTMQILQKGVYELSENDEGQPMIRICLDDINRELPEDYNYTEYLLKEEDEHILLTLVTNEFSLDGNPMILVPLKGENGLLSGKCFDGIYQMGKEGDNYQYIFKEDGSIAMQINEKYYADEEKMILSDYAGSTEYLYELSDNMLILKNLEEEPVLTLKKAQAD